MDILCVEAAGVGIVFRMFMQKARTFIPKSSYFHILFLMFQVWVSGVQLYYVVILWVFWEYSMVIICEYCMGILLVFCEYSVCDLLVLCKYYVYFVTFL